MHGMCVGLLLYLFWPFSEEPCFGTAAHITEPGFFWFTGRTRVLGRGPALSVHAHHLSSLLTPAAIHRTLQETRK